MVLEFAQFIDKIGRNPQELLTKSEKLIKIDELSSRSEVGLPEICHR